MTTGRRQFMYGALTGVSTAAAISLPSMLQEPEPAAPPAPEQTPEQLFGQPSFAQQGEDLALASFLNGHLKIPQPSYIDIGAGHPIIGNNTFKFYRQGGRGVLVEPNPMLAEMLRQFRPGDTVIEAGIGVSDQSEADYYVFKKYGQLNTFSKEQADKILGQYGQEMLKAVLKRKLLNLNDVLAEHFKGGGPHVLSIDIEGLDEAVLRTLDFEKHRLPAFCVETMALGTGRLEEGIFGLMASKGYEVRGGSFVNSIFVDRRLL